jgi:hypothetical protein
MAAIANAKRKQPKCKVRFEWILWITVAMMALMLISVNFMLLELQKSDHTKNDSSNKNNIKSDGKGDTISVKKTTFSHKNTPARTTTTTTKAAEVTPSQDHDWDPLLKILKQAKIEDTPELRKKLPSWQQVIDRFGAEAKIVGLDTCEEYRASVPAAQRSVAPGGPFNSGTNLLHDVLQRNCHIPGTKTDRTGILWQVNWGKHQPPRYRLENYVRSFNNTAFLPIVPLRDPYGWMQSMCKNMYSARWDHDHRHCPNIIPNKEERTLYDRKKVRVQKELLDKAGLTLENDTVPVRVDYKSGTIHHQSLAHMWSDWYQEYYDATFPRLMVRLEDLVFHPEQVLRQICDCVGGTFSKELILQGQSPKQGEGHGVNPTDLTGAMIKHVFSNRTKGMTVEDLQHASRILDGSLMDLFGYSHPV